MLLTPGKPFFLLPRKFILGHTLENVGPASSRICGVLSDKSTLARAGLRTHGDAGFIEPTNVLRPTLEIYNDGELPIALYLGMHICQMRFALMQSACENGYSLNGKYAGSQTVELPK
jgi:dCTP deaminase